MNAVLSLTQAPHATFYNGGEAPHARQNFARMTQGRPVPPASRIDAAIAGMEPGTVRPVYLSTDRVFSVRRPDSSGEYSILDWTPKCAWHQATQQIIHGGLRIRNKVIAYSDVVGDWREEAMPTSFSRYSGTGHWYGLTAQDDAGNVYLRNAQLNPETWEYRALPSHISTNGGNGSMFAWMSNALDGRGGLVKYGGSVRRFLMLDTQAWQWAFHKDGLPGGQHALIEYHKTHGKLLMVGGSGTSKTAALVDQLGVATRVADCPDDVSMAPAAWIVPHPAGCWLVRSSLKNMLAYWPVEDRWDSLGPSPDASLGDPTVAVDEARGIVLIVHAGGISAYKFPAL